MRGRAYFKAFFKVQYIDEFLSDHKYGYCPWGYEGVSNTARDSFCDDENQYFLKLQILLPTFTQLDHVANVADFKKREMLLRGQILENRVLQNRSCKDLRMMMLVWDTGASNLLTLFSSDFHDYLRCYLPVKYVTKVNRVIVIRSTIHKFIDRNVQDILFPCISYHLTQIDVYLFHPQTYHQIHCGHSGVQENEVTMHLSFHRIYIPVNIGGTNLPVCHNSFMTDHQKQAIDTLMRTSLDYSRF